MALGFAKTGLQPIGKIKVPDIFYNRYKSGIDEIDDLFGDGALPGAVFTLCAKGGLGKSTLMLQLLQAYSMQGYDVAYLSGEESKFQIAYKCGHLGVSDVPVDNITDIDEILELINSGDIDFMVLDSFQHITTKRDMSGRAIQKFAVDEICKAAQKSHCCVFIIMHVTKAGQLKGDSYVPHTVDVNMEIRSGEDEYGDKKFRIVEIPTKNRFGPPTEFIAEMTGNGYKFTVDVEPVEANKGKVNKRTAAKQSEFDAILTLLDPPAITPERVMEELDVDYNHAYGRLAELTKNRKLIKYGKGQQAIFKVITDDEK